MIACGVFYNSLPITQTKGQPNTIEVSPVRYSGNSSLAIAGILKYLKSIFNICKCIRRMRIDHDLLLGDAMVYQPISHQSTYKT